jgi:ribonuclease T
MKNDRKLIANRFRGLLPVVVDLETSGLNPQTDALLEIAIVTLKMDENGLLSPDKTEQYHIDPFPGAHINPEAMEINKIRIDSALRLAIPEDQALLRVFNTVEELVKINQCQRGIWVGHNVWFDLAFIQMAMKRCNLKKSPFHSFTTLDTASLSAVALGETVLARAAKAAGISFDLNEAHSAIYDAEKTAELFCRIVNQWKNF